MGYGKSAATNTTSSQHFVDDNDMSSTNSKPFRHAQCMVCCKKGPGETERTKDNAPNELKRCPTCRTLYCSPECQRQDWKTHKRICHKGARASGALLFTNDDNANLNMGRSVRALCDVPPFSLLWVEKPLAAVPVIPLPSAPLRAVFQRSFPANCAMPKSEIELQADLNPEAKLDEALDLKYSPQELWSRFCANPNNSTEDELSNLTERVRTANSFAMMSLSFLTYGAAFCEKAASFNHACLPNAVYRFGLDGLLFVFSHSKPIAAGDEVTIPYFSVHMAQELCVCERQRLSTEEMGFACVCLDCRKAKPCPSGDHPTSPNLDNEQMLALEDLQQAEESSEIVAALCPVWRRHFAVFGRTESLLKLFVSKFVLALEQINLLAEARAVLLEAAYAADAFRWSPFLFPSPAYMRMRALRGVALGRGEERNVQLAWLQEMREAMPWTDDVLQFDPVLRVLQR